MNTTKQDLQLLENKLSQKIDNSYKELREEIQNSNDELRVEIQNSNKELREEFRKSINQKPNWLVELLATLPDFSQFATKGDFQELKDEIAELKGIVIGINTRENNDYAMQQVEIIHHREWLEKHDKEIREIKNKSAKD